MDFLFSLSGLHRACRTSDGFVSVVCHNPSGNIFWISKIQIILSRCLSVFTKVPFIAVPHSDGYAKPPVFRRSRKLLYDVSMICKLYKKRERDQAIPSSIQTRGSLFIKKKKKRM